MLDCIHHHLLVFRWQRVCQEEFLLRRKTCALQAAFGDDLFHRRPIKVFEQIPCTFWCFGGFGDHQREVIDIVGSPTFAGWKMPYVNLKVDVAEIIERPTAIV